LASGHHCVKFPAVVLTRSNSAAANYSISLHQDQHDGTERHSKIFFPLFVFQIRFKFTQCVVVIIIIASLIITILRSDNYNFLLIRRHLEGKSVNKYCVIYIDKKALTDVKYANLLLLLLSSSSSLVSN